MVGEVVESDDGWRDVAGMMGMSVGQGLAVVERKKPQV